MNLQLRELRHYFFDLPLWAAGCRTQSRWRHMRSFLAPQAAAFEAGLRMIDRYRGKAVNQSEIDKAVDYAIQITIARESDTFACLRPAALHFDLEGFEHLRDALGHQRPVIVLTGHFGNFYITAAALAKQGLAMYTLARSVATSNPLARQLYEQSNYALTERAMLGRYIYTDFAGKLDRYLITICREKGLLAVLPDLPQILFPTGRRKVQMLGRSSSLPGRMIELGIKYNAIFLTAWNTIVLEEGFKFRRKLRFEPHISDAVGVEGILQEYADRLTDVVWNEPWQWLGTSIISQYDESEL